MTSPRNAAPRLTLGGGGFLREGRPHRIRSGSLHYFRVHPDQWQDRIRRLAALGLNAVDSYVPWNFHERRRGRRRFDGWQDVERFFGLIADAGLDAIVRPGPYICAEWDNGGLPAWLTGTPGLRPRSSDPGFLEAVGEWFDALVPRLARLQACQGGPIVAVQVENEFGSFGDDVQYLESVRRMLVDGGIREMLFTADGPTDLALDGGTMHGVLAAATFGSRVGEAAGTMRARRPAEPLFCAELWSGWFDHWGERHHVRPADGAARTLTQLMDADASVNLYMAHGGTNFGLWSGANHDGTRVQPTQTSYDSDAPVAEDGSLTAKFFAFRAIFARSGAGELPPVPLQQPRLAPRLLRTTHRAELLPALRAAAEPIGLAHPPTFEELGLDAGLVLYRATPLLPEREVRLTIGRLRDRALVFADGAMVAVMDASTAADGVVLPGRGRRVELEILVENQGRINFGPLLGEGKGILDGVWVDWRRVNGWTARALPLDEWGEGVLATLAGRGASDADPSSAGVATAELVVDEPGDAFLAFPGFSKGFVWINDFLLGRYWEIGPQETYYVPAPLLRRGMNIVTVLELERCGAAIAVCAEARLGPVEVYSEDLAVEAAESNRAHDDLDSVTPA
ncbi:MULTISPECIES: beta-galactosidase family protein [Microbacterium]|uniref:glycoside hydrolase family 35 protein n=1 Tax=Microbacterium TaxID=33882 RepID=UPI00146EF64E|nr:MULTISPECIES: beta-galactosidase family protein [Microbacterium]